MRRLAGTAGGAACSAVTNDLDALADRGFGRRNAPDIAPDIADVRHGNFGLGWRPELAASIFANLDRIDVVEVIAEDWLDERDFRALRLLGATVPVILHGTSLGLASTHPVDSRRLDHMARLVDAIQPVMWSEHLAFVRAGGVEIGHLAAPPRTAATIEGLVANVDRARRVVGIAPALENIATLIDPPLSDMDEIEFVTSAIRACDVPLLLDLHNLHANATNFGWDAYEGRARFESKEAVMAMRASGERPAAIVMFEAAGSEPSVSMWTVEGRASRT